MVWGLCTPPQCLLLHLDLVHIPDGIGICESSRKLVGLFKMVTGRSNNFCIDLPFFY